MKKGILIIIGVFVGVLIAFTWFHCQTSNIAYVDTNILMQKYEGMKKAQVEFQQKTKIWQATSDTLIKQWEADLKSYEKERAGMTNKEKQLKEELLRNRQQQINQYQQAIQTKSKNEEAKLTQVALNEINEYITNYGKKHGYKYILGANGTGNILFADKENDITEIILTALNQNYIKP
jgi:outer membrane protein